MDHGLEIDADGTVDFGDAARGILNQQCQYASRYVGGRGSAPDLSSGLRISGDPANYHSLRIHSDDVGEFVSRVTAHRNRYA